MFHSIVSKQAVTTGTCRFFFVSGAFGGEWTALVMLLQLSSVSFYVFGVLSAHSPFLVMTKFALRAFAETAVANLILIFCVAHRVRGLCLAHESDQFSRGGLRFLKTILRFDPHGAGC